MNDLDLCYMTLSRAAGLIKARKLSPVELTDALLPRANETQSNRTALLTVWPRNRR